MAGKLRPFALVQPRIHLTSPPHSSAIYYLSLWNALPPRGSYVLTNTRACNTHTHTPGLGSFHPWFGHLKMFFFFSLPASYNCLQMVVFTHWTDRADTESIISLARSQTDVLSCLNLCHFLLWIRKRRKYLKSALYIWRDFTSRCTEHREAKEDWEMRVNEQQLSTPLTHQLHWPF